MMSDANYNRLSKINSMLSNEVNDELIVAIKN